MSGAEAFYAGFGLGAASAGLAGIVVAVLLRVWYEDAIAGMCEAIDALAAARRKWSDAA